MKIFKLCGNKRFQRIALKSLNGRKSTDILIESYHRSLEIKDLEPIEFDVQNDYDLRVKKGDYFEFMFGMIPVFSQRTVDVLKEILENNGQLFPMYLNGETVYAYNVLNFPEFEMKKQDKKKFIYIKKQNIDDLYLFRIHVEKYITRVYFTEKFVELVKEHKLLGFSFRHIGYLFDFNELKKENK